MKIKLTLTATLIYTPDPKFYYPDATAASMMQTDLFNAECDPSIILENPNTSIKVEGMILADEPLTPAPEPDDLEEHNRNEAADYADE